MSDAWDTGMIGVQEAMWGVVDMLGATTDYEPLKHIGEAGVNRARSRIADRGHFIMDYKDVDDFWTAMEYMGNMAAISLCLTWLSQLVVHCLLLLLEVCHSLLLPLSTQDRRGMRWRVRRVHP